MSCDECVFMDKQRDSRMTIPCNSCQADDSDKGFCIASRSPFGYVPIVTRIHDCDQAKEIFNRGRVNGSDVELLQWSRERNAFMAINDQTN